MQVGKLLIIIGVVFIGVGLLVNVMEKIPGIDKLPGDIYVKKENFTFYFPLTTCLLISVIMSFIFILLNKK